MRSDGKVLSSNLYEFVRWYHNERYLVYSIDKDQYDFLFSRDIEKEKGKAENICSSKPILFCDSNISRLISDEVNGCYYFDDNQLRYSEEMLAVTTDEITNVDDATVIAYTTETVEDVIDSFKEFENINLSELIKKEQGPVRKLVKW